MPEEEDVEDYLARIKRRWDSALLSEEQNQQRWNRWIGENEERSVGRQLDDRRGDTE